jgi:leucyl-tRNA synthetase
VFSRQRYWGEPIPIYFPVTTQGDPRTGAAYSIDYDQPIPLEDSALPLLLPELEDYRPGDPQGPLARALDWRFFQRDGKWFARETNTMPQWAGSCWYYLRFLDPHNTERLFDYAAYDAWMPVDLYMGGSEHAVLHLLYARFWHKVLFDVGVVKHREPFSKLVHQGMVLGMAYRWYAVVDPSGQLLEPLAGDDPRVVPDQELGFKLRKTDKKVDERWLLESQVSMLDGIPHHPEHKVAVVPVAEKMSKTRGNVVNPDDVVQSTGADSLRLYEMFMGPLEQVKPWQTIGLMGCRRFLDRVYTLGSGELAPEPPDPETEKLVHRTVKKVQEDIEALRLNTAVSAMMILTNHLVSLAKPPKSAIENLVLCLAPFAPHLAEELWGILGHAPSIADHPWPAYDEALCIDDEVEVAVQVNGRVRGRVRLSRTADEGQARELALSDQQVQKFIENQPVKKLIYVPGRIINIILG